MTAVHTPYTTVLKIIDATTFFCLRQLKGSIKAVRDGRLLGALLAGLKGVSRDLKMDQKGRCMSPNFTVPFPAMFRRVSGRRRITETMIAAAKIKSTQNIERNPRK
jgi:hypothetical protein